MATTPVDPLRSPHGPEFPLDQFGSTAPPAPAPAPTPERRDGFFGWVAAHPKPAFFGTSCLALLIGLGLGAATQSTPPSTGDRAGLEARFGATRAELGATKDALATSTSQLSTSQDQLRNAQTSLTAAKHDLKTAQGKRASDPAVARQPAAPVSAGSSAGSFSGSGEKNLGTIRVPVESLLKWRGGGGLFMVTNDFGDADTIDVSSQASSGETTVAAGTYHKVDVLGSGGWSFSITPK